MKLELNSQNDTKLIINEKGCISLLDMHKVIYLSCEGYLTTIHTVDNFSISTSKLIKEYEKELVGSGFIRVSNCIVVNIRYIKSVNGGKEKYVVLNNKDRFKISQKRYQFVRNFLLQKNNDMSEENSEE